MEKFGFIYIWRDRKHKRYYIGAHWGTEDDGYICSSNWMRSSHKRRPQDFKRRILSRNYQTKKEMFEAEDKWLDLIKEDEFGKRYYNLQKHWKHWSAKPYKNVREKISIRTKEAMWSPEVREKMLKLYSSEERKNNLSKGLKNAWSKKTIEERKEIGAKIQETRKKNNNMTPWNKGLVGVQTHSLETRKKISQANSGDKNCSKRLDVRKKLVQNHWTKTKTKDEQVIIRNKMREANRRKKHADIQTISRRTVQNSP